MLPALKSIKSLAVRCPNWVGDIVMATPVFECLRDNFPNAHIAACVRPYARGILEDDPHIDRIIDCDDNSLGGMRNIRRELKEINPEVGLLLTNTTHSFITFKAAGIPLIYGYKRNFRKYFLAGGPMPEMIDGKYKPLPMQDYYLELCRYLGLEMPEHPGCKLYLSNEVAEQGSDRLQRFGINDEELVIGLNPGASFGSSKCWPAENFARLAEMLQDRFQCKLLLLVGPGEEEIATVIVKQSAATIINTSKEKVNLAELKPLIKRCNLLITNDTGPRHYASAFKVPNLVLMGPTNPIYTESDLEKTVVIRRELDCSPCHKKVCPLKHHACMNEITPPMVLMEAESMLGQAVL